MFFLTGGDNHASCTVKAINAATGRASYTNSVVWTTSPSGGGRDGGVASPPATAAPPTQQSIFFEVVPPSPPATAAPWAAACSSPLPSPAPARAATAAPPAAARTSPLLPPNEYDLELCHFDVDQVFVRADLNEDVFMNLPDGCGAISGKIVKLNKSLYGLRQASRQ